MIDGADGLAGGIVAISLGALIVVAMNQGAGPGVTNGLVVILGATLAFLLFNSGVLGHGQKVFLGDSGSMLLGIILASYYIGMSQGEDAYMSPVVAGWFFGLPLMDSIAVMVRRIVSGVSPLSAGRDHLHHRLMSSGLSGGRCVAVMLTLHAALVSIGIVGNYYEFSSPVMFWSFVVMVVGYFFLSPALISQIRVIGIGHRPKVSNS